MYLIYLQQRNMIFVATRQYHFLQPISVDTISVKSNANVTITVTAITALIISSTCCVISVVSVRYKSHYHNCQSRRSSTREYLPFESLVMYQ